MRAAATERGGLLERAPRVTRCPCSGPTEAGRGEARASSEREPPSQEQWHGRQEPAGSPALEQDRPAGQRGAQPPLCPVEREGQALGHTMLAQVTCFRCSGFVSSWVLCLLVNSATATSCQHLSPMTDSLAPGPSVHLTNIRLPREVSAGEACLDPRPPTQSTAGSPGPWSASCALLPPTYPAQPSVLPLLGDLVTHTLPQLPPL